MKNTLLLLVAICASLLTACVKEGPGGKSSITVHVEHHGKNIPGATVYLKYNAKESPGLDSSVYDESKRLADTGHLATHGHFHELQKGDYFLYATGYDSAIALPVRGGIHVKLGRAEEL